MNAAIAAEAWSWSGSRSGSWTGVRSGGVYRHVVWESPRPYLEDLLGVDFHGHVHELLGVLEQPRQLDGGQQLARAVDLSPARKGRP